METLDVYRDRMQRALTVCSLRGLAVDMQEIEDRIMRADILSELHPLEPNVQVQYLKDTACNLLMEERVSAE